MAPGDFGIYSHDLFVGQFGSGKIAAYDPANGGLATALYFSAGPEGEAHGLFGTITPIQNTLGNAQ
jgi:hypothetical protein